MNSNNKFNKVSTSSQASAAFRKEKSKKRNKNIYSESLKEGYLIRAMWNTNKTQETLKYSLTASYMRHLR